MISATRIIMGMPVRIKIVDTGEHIDLVEKVFAYFKHVDEKFSPYKENSEVNKIVREEIRVEDISEEMTEILHLAEKTKQETFGFFDVYYNRKFNPSGLVKGWAIKKASEILDDASIQNYIVDAGGDIQTKGLNNLGKEWRVGIKNPFNTSEVIKVMKLSGEGIATSGTYIRGEHIFDPHNKKKINEVASITVIASDIYDADRMATAAFAMGEEGINFIEKLPGYEGYMVKYDQTAVFTSNLTSFVIEK